MACGSCALKFSVYMATVCLIASASASLPFCARSVGVAKARHAIAATMAAIRRGLMLSSSLLDIGQQCTTQCTHAHVPARVSASFGRLGRAVPLAGDHFERRRHIMLSHNIHPASRTTFLKNGTDMKFGSALADAQLCCDLLVGTSLYEKSKNLPFARR